VACNLTTGDGGSTGACNMPSVGAIIVPLPPPPLLLLLKPVAAAAALSCWAACKASVHPVRVRRPACTQRVLGVASVTNQLPSRECAASSPVRCDNGVSSRALFHHDTSIRLTPYLFLPVRTIFYHTPLSVLYHPYTYILLLLALRSS